MAKNVVDELSKDAANAAASSDITPKIIRHINRVLQLQAHMLELNEELKEASGEVRKIVEKQIPELMQSVDLISLVVEDDKAQKYKVDVKTSVYPSVSQERMPKVCEWLEANGHGGCIKNLVVVDIGKEEESEGQSETKRVIDAIRKVSNRPVDLKRTVHAQTLKSLLRELVEKKENVPLDLFNAQVIDHANIKPVRR